MRKGEISLDQHAVGLLRAGRSALHWSQDNLAHNAGISPATVKRLESRANEILKDALHNMGVQQTTLIRREKVEALLVALQKSGVTIWRDELRMGISLPGQYHESEFFDIAERIRAQYK